MWPTVPSSKKFQRVPRKEIIMLVSFCQKKVTAHLRVNAPRLKFVYLCSYRRGQAENMGVESQACDEQAVTRTPDLGCSSAHEAPTQLWFIIRLCLQPVPRPSHSPSDLFISVGYHHDHLQQRACLRKIHLVLRRARSISQVQRTVIR
ncbi:hypothetical protein PM082_019627 [Marasmius tenuissimus]|nr:hypothetical protein PM082_019627 [Marasmius tenuissimus]